VKYFAVATNLWDWKPKRLWSRFSSWRHALGQLPLPSTA
jgi:hypothetical protein